MGRQVEFFMHPDDVAEFEAWLRKDQETLVLDREAPSRVPKVLDSLASERLDLLQRRYLVRKSDLRDVRMRLVEARRLWLIDNDRSPVVEIDLSPISRKRMRRGRLYFHPDFLDSDGELVDKPSDFVAWADGLLRWIRRRYKRDPKTGCYVGPHAAAWRAREGGQFVM